MSHSHSRVAYSEKVPEEAKRLQARERQARRRIQYPDYWKEWMKRVGYPGTAAGQREWRERRKEEMGVEKRHQ